jgi:pyruvate/2-oxoglutarate dehydrogenase complex dihydrolipoamide dehydrogenase (E3) component
VDIRDEHPNLAAWDQLIDASLADENSEPIVNLARDEDVVYDAIFLGGGAGGRFGASYMRAMGGRPLIIDAWPFLGGSCPHQACVPHHLFSEAAEELDRMRWFSGELFFPTFDESRAKITDLIKLFLAGRGKAHAFMNWQTKEQLDVEYVLNARGTIIDKNTVEAAGRTFRAHNLVLGMGARPVWPEIPGLDLAGVYDFVTFVEELDYEPTKCVIIGGSKVAMEYGAFFHATGCDTTIVSRSELMRTQSLHHVDEDLRQYVVEGMRLRGMTILEGAHPVRVNGENGRAVSVTVRLADGSETDLPCDMVYLGTGEKPQLQGADTVLGCDILDTGRVKVNKRMQTSVPGVYAIGDMIDGPMEMFKARKSGVTAARNIMGEDLEFDYSEYPDFLHTTYEVTWVGLSESEARERYGDVILIQMPPTVKDLDTENLPLPCAEGTMLYAFSKPHLTGFQKLIVDPASRRIVGIHHVGYGAKDAFQYLDYLIHRPEGLTIDELGWMNELFLNPEHFIQLSRLRAGSGAPRNL